MILISICLYILRLCNVAYCGLCAWCTYISCTSHTHWTGSVHMTQFPVGKMWMWLTMWCKIPPNSQGNMCSFDASQMHIKNPHSAWYHMISILEPYLSPNDMLRLLQPPVFHVASNHRIPTSWFPRVPVVRRSKLMGINSFRWVCHMSHQPIIKPASTEIGAINST